jgi:hypothetical protein
MTKLQSKVLRSFQIKTMTQLAQGKFDSVTLKNDIFTKWLVGYMVSESIAFKLIPMGGGVTRIVREGVCCPHCMGKGFLSKKEAGEVQAS